MEPMFSDKTGSPWWREKINYNIPICIKILKTISSYFKCSFIMLWLSGPLKNLKGPINHPQNVIFHLKKRKKNYFIWFFSLDKLTYTSLKASTFRKLLHILAISIFVILLM